ncbi:MAG TPA: HXXEE domain-containing protein [Gemmatimonadales bacterium]|nr:HXXEE domain-containing protein [Gemmatimonadales bacterium]
MKQTSPSWFDLHWAWIMLPVALLHLAIASVLMPSWALDRPYWLFVLAPAFVMLHQFEEHGVPGGFDRWLNETEYRSPRSDFPLTPRLARQANVGLAYVPVYIGAILNERALWFAFFVLCLCSINGWYHITMSYSKQRYSPGAITSLTLFLPATALAGERYISNGMLSWWGAGSAFSVALLLTAASFSLLKRRLDASIRAAPG